MEYSKKRDDSIILDIFQGQMFKAILCPCEHKNYGIENFLVLHLDFPINEKKIHSIQDLICNFLSKEELDEENKFTCETCKLGQICTKISRIYGYPQILIIQLKRFENKNARTTNKNSNRIKIDDKIKFETDESKSSTSIQYSIYAIINHSGTLSFGHYTAQCLGLKDNNWYNLNDSRVFLTRNPCEFPSEDCYILFYKRL